MDDRAVQGIAYRTRNDEIMMTEKNEDGKMPENGGDAASPQEESQCGHRAPGAEAGSGQEEEKTAAATEPAVPEENAELEWSRRHVRTRRPAHKVFRKTELHDRPSSIFSTRAAGKKRRTRHGNGDPEFQVPEEMQEFAESLFGHLDSAAEDLYLQVALVDEQVDELDKIFRKTSGHFERRIAELEERGRWT